MSDWERILKFYENASRRPYYEYGEFGEKMLILVERLQHELDHNKVEVSTAMYDLMIWNQAGTCIHIGWGDQSYHASTNAFEDGGVAVSPDEIISHIEQILY